MASPVENLYSFMYLNNVLYVRIDKIEEIPSGLPSHYECHIIKGNQYFRANYYSLLNIVSHLQFNFDDLTLVTSESMNILQFHILIKDFDTFILTPEKLEIPDLINLLRSLST